ncbi:hypothetical protein BH20ACI1_BH20ACI1_21630 [soil metagenome]
MNILMIADVVARPGRLAVLEKIKEIREEYKIDIATMNAENVAGGFSITPAIADELFESGIDLMTSGNHIFDKGEIIPYIKKIRVCFVRQIIRPERREAVCLSAKSTVSKSPF